jgi:hypothetical protein
MDEANCKISITVKFFVPYIQLIQVSIAWIPTFLHVAYQ